MNIKEKTAYLKGLLKGLDLDKDKKETKLFSAIIDLLEDTSLCIDDLENDMDDVCDQLEIIDEDLAEVENEIFENECDCCCNDDCCCGDDCECGYNCGEDDDVFYEVICPSCKEQICLAEDTLLDEKMDCPNCGELLEFDLEDLADSCNCTCECDHETNCESDHDCDCCD